jgi:hypothetical protein
LKRFNFRARIGNITFFFMLAKTQTLEGVTSLQPDGAHIVMWDLENCTLEQSEETLRKVQRKYGLSHIYIASDSEGLTVHGASQKLTTKHFCISYWTLIT